MLKARGLVNYWESLAGIGSAMLTPEGKNLAESFVDERSSPVQRRIQLRDDYLTWLYQEIEVEDRNPSPADFLASGRTYWGEPYTEADLIKAGEWLKNAGFIDGAAAWQYSAPLHPTLTPKGIWTVEHSRSVNDESASSGQVFNTVVHGSANVSNAGSDFAQNIDQSQTWISEAASLLDTLEQAKSVLNLGDELDELIAKARGELTDEPHPRRVRQTFTAVAGFLGRASSGALGGVLAKQVLDFLAALPG